MLERTLISISALTLLACAATAESGPEKKMLCAPGAQIQCACPKGVHGVQACRPDGAGYTKCDCGGGSIPGQNTGGSTTGSGGGDPGAGGESNNPGSGGETSNGGAGGDPGSGGGWNNTGGWAGGSAGPVGDYAGGVSISEVAIYQAVKVSLVQNGAAVAQKNAPIVEGRPALVRVSVKPSGGFSSRPITALLDLKSSNPAVSAQTTTLTVSGSSNDLDLGSTFNFTLPPDQVTADLTLQVSLHEPSGSSVGAVEAGAIAPAQGPMQVGAEQSGAIRVTIVPFRYYGDGSGRLPDTSDKQMQAYRDILFAMYPTTEVVLGLHAPVDYSGQIGPGWGWSEWLDTLCDVRIQDGGDSKTYYFGISAPTASWSQYGGGVAGLGNVPSADGNWGRCAVGLGFPGADPSGFIMAHEVGHTMGRPHAPCGVDGEPFPYPGASIGVPGYSLVSQKIKDPNTYTDLMGYCDPQWISDVNFQKLFKRIKWVNQNYFKTNEVPRAYRKLIVDLDGSVKWGGRVTLTEKLDGVPTRVDLLSPQGSAVGSLEGTFTSFSEPPAGALFIPDLPTGVSAVSALGHSAIPVPP